MFVPGIKDCEAGVTAIFVREIVSSFKDRCVTFGNICEARFAQGDPQS